MSFAICQSSMWDYDDPEIKCGCSLKTPRWTSWTNDSPGMRFHACPKPRRKGSGFFRFIDPPDHTNLLSG
jgi:hypothetical protein